MELSNQKMAATRPEDIRLNKKKNFFLKFPFINKEEKKIKLINAIYTHYLLKQTHQTPSLCIADRTSLRDDLEKKYDKNKGSFKTNYWYTIQSDKCQFICCFETDCYQENPKIILLRVNKEIGSGRFNAVFKLTDEAGDSSFAMRKRFNFRSNNYFTKSSEEEIRQEFLRTAELKEILINHTHLTDEEKNVFDLAHLPFGSFPHHLTKEGLPTGSYIVEKLRPFSSFLKPYLTKDQQAIGLYEQIAHIPESIKTLIATDLIHAVFLLQAHQICHNDLKFDNLCFNKKNRLCVVDLSSYKTMQEMIKLPYCERTGWFTHTAVATNPDKAYLQDVYSLGILLFLLYSGVNIAEKKPLLYPNESTTMLNLGMGGQPNMEYIEEMLPFSEDQGLRNKMIHRLIAIDFPSAANQEQLNHATTEVRHHLLLLTKTISGHPTSSP